MIELLSTVPIEAVTFLAGVGLGYGCPKCAKAILERFDLADECEDCPEGGCLFCPRCDD